MGSAASREPRSAWFTGALHCEVVRGWFSGIFNVAPRVRHEVARSVAARVPAVAFVGIAIPALFWMYGYRQRNGTLPTLRGFAQKQRPLLRTALGAALCVAGSYLFSSLLFSFDAWTEWLAKVSLLDKDPHVNHISLRALIAGSGHHQHAILRSRMPLFIAALALCATLVGLACRRSDVRARFQNPFSVHDSATLTCCPSSAAIHSWCAFAIVTGP